MTAQKLTWTRPNVERTELRRTLTGGGSLTDGSTGSSIP